MFASTDPTKVPSVQLLTRSGRKIPENDTDGMFWRDKPATDCFNRFPLETREAIAGFLPTASFLNLRLATRAMAIIFDSTRFWKTRFYPNEERGFLFWLLQKNNPRYRKMDWRLLYHATNKVRVGGAKFQTRVHIWTRHRWLRDVCLMIRDIGSTSSLTQTVDIAPSFQKIGVSILKEQKNTCITGMEFIYGDRPNLNIEYKIPGKSMTVYMSSLKEIKAGVGKNGIYAIQLVSHTFESEWLGDRNEDHTTTSRFMLEGGSIQAMEIRFDVSLKLSTNRSGLTLNRDIRWLCLKWANWTMQNQDVNIV